MIQILPRTFLLTSKPDLSLNILTLFQKQTLVPPVIRDGRSLFNIQVSRLITLEQCGRFGLLRVRLVYKSNARNWAMDAL